MYNFSFCKKGDYVSTVFQPNYLIHVMENNLGMYAEQSITDFVQYFMDRT
jgi:hypothetical protein